MRSHRFTNVSYRGAQSAPGGALAEQRGRVTSRDLLATILLMQPRIWLAFWATNTASSYVMFHPAVPPRLSLHQFIPQPILVLGIAPALVQHLIEVWGSLGPTSQACQCPPGGYLFPLTHTSTAPLHLGVIYKPVEGAFNPTACVINEDVK